MRLLCDVEVRHVSVNCYGDCDDDDDDDDDRWEGAAGFFWQLDSVAQNLACISMLAVWGQICVQ